MSGCGNMRPGEEYAIAARRQAIVAQLSEYEMPVFRAVSRFIERWPRKCDPHAAIPVPGRGRAAPRNREFCRNLSAT